MADPPLRIMNFISEHQLEEFREQRGDRVEDGAVQRDKPLFQILKENKDKQQAEFNERFKHRPPKALDEDETEFLEQWEMSKREYEKKLANEKAEELRNFRAAVATHTMNIIVSNEQVPQKTEDLNLTDKKTAHAQARRPLSSLIKITPQPKKQKLISENNDKQIKSSTKSDEVKEMSADDEPKKQEIVLSGAAAGLAGLVSYSDESEDDSD